LAGFSGSRTISQTDGFCGDGRTAIQAKSFSEAEKVLKLAGSQDPDFLLSDGLLAATDALKYNQTPFLMRKKSSYWRIFQDPEQFLQLTGFRSV
jgi:hypothetical protein